MTIDYLQTKIVQIKKQFSGTTEDGRKFIIQANWNNIDKWKLELIYWESNDGTDNDNHEISKIFLNHINQK